MFYSSVANCYPSNNLADLFLSLRGTPIDSDGFVDVYDIGSSNDTALLCLTNETDCCTMGLGVWQFPNGTVLLTHHSLGGGAYTGFGRNRGPSVVRLFRFNSPPQRGRFSCDLLGSTIYVNICE